MEITIVVSLITLAGVVLSTLLNYYANRRTVKSEFLKITSDIEQGFTTRILEERKVRYPAIYGKLSQLAKQIQEEQDGLVKKGGNLNKDILSSFKQELDALDIQHAIFFSTQTASELANLRDLIYEYIKELENEGTHLSVVSLHNLRKQIGFAEMGLKKDIGIPIDEFQDIRVKYNKKEYKNYK